jgi:hypothetical protein
MVRLLIAVLILIVGAVVLAPAVALIGLDPLPGDFTVTWNDMHIAVPAIYSLCASLALALFYLAMKR